MVLCVFYFVKDNHTPQNAILCFLAMTDMLAALKLSGYIVNAKSKILHATHAGCLFKLSHPHFLDFASLDVLVILCTDRYIAMKHPLWYIGHITTKTVVKIVTTVLFVEFLFSVVLFCNIYDYNENEPNLLERCSNLNLPRNYLLAAFFKLWIVTVVSATLTAYVAFVAFKRFKQKEVRAANVKNEHGEVKKTVSDTVKLQKKDIKTMITLMFLYVVLWLPTLTIPFYVDFLPRDTLQLGYLVSQHCISINSYMNAFVYAWQKPRFKKAARYFLTNRFSKWKDVNKFMNLTTTAALFTAIEHNLKRNVQTFDKADQATPEPLVANDILCINKDTVKTKASVNSNFSGWARLLRIKDSTQVKPLESPKKQTSLNSNFLNAI